MIAWIKSVKRSFTPQQFVFFAIFVAVLSVIPVLYRCWNEFARFRKLERPDYDNTSWNDYILVAYLTPIVFLCQWLTHRYTKDFFRNKFSYKFEGEALNQRIFKATKSLFKAVFYFGIFFFGLYVYSDTNYMSHMMFGSGNMMYLDSDWPFGRQPNYLKFYYMLGISYHTSDMVHLFLNSAQKDFFEMLLHHYITIMLIIGSYMTNFWNSGINVMIQMDAAECFVGVLRAFNDILPNWLIGIIFFFCNWCWVYFRLIVYTYEVIIQGSMIGRWRFDYNTNHQTTMQILLMILLALNAYWQFLFLNMFYRLIFKGENKDIQNPVEDVDKDNSKVNCHS